MDSIESLLSYVQRDRRLTLFPFIPPSADLYTSPSYSLYIYIPLACMYKQIAINTLEKQCAILFSHRLLSETIFNRQIEMGTYTIYDNWGRSLY